MNTASSSKNLRLRLGLLSTRKFLLSAAALPAALLYTACQADDMPAAAGAATLISAATQCVDTEARSAVDSTRYDNGEVGINWMPADRIGVFGSSGSANVQFANTSTAPAGRTVFSGQLKNGEEARYAYYPYSASAGTNPKALSGNLPAVQIFDSATGEIQGDYKIGIPDGDPGRFSFRHIFGFLRFDIDAAGSGLQGELLESITLSATPAQGITLAGDFTFDCTTGTATMAQQGSSTLTMKWKNHPTLHSSAFSGYMSVAPAPLDGRTLDIEIRTNMHVARFSVEPRVKAIEANRYYTVPLTVSHIETLPSYSVEERTDLPQGSVMPALSSRLACANRVFSLPSTPFMHKIRVPEADATISVYGLPEGLTWNSRRSLVQGSVAAEGEYTYTVAVTPASGEPYVEGVSLTVSSDLHQPVPHMGWQSWNVLETKIDQASILAVADNLVSKGFRDAGYIWLGIDDCWQKLDGSRDADGVPVVNPDKFPDGLKVVTDYIHSKGLKAGIYSDAGDLTCASGSQGGGTLLGAYGYEEAHARTFTEWGFDKLKEDWFWTGHGDANGQLDPNSTSLARELYMRMGTGIKAAGNKILLSMCEWGLHEPWKWGPEAGASSWRMSYDARDGWMGKLNNKANNPTRNEGGIGLKNTIDLMRHLWPYAGVNRFNDADMLCVGIRGKGTSSNDLVYGSAKGMNDDEYETNFAMWCMWSSPLLITLDVRDDNINAHDKALLLNPELIAINQDPMGQQAEFIKSVGNLDYYCKDLADGSVAIAVVNLGDSQASYTITISDYDALESPAAYSLRDLIARSDAGTLTATTPKTGTLRAHATAVFRLTRQ